MKITCQSCQAKYTIADEKVAGKTVKIKCKKCGATIVVNGSETGAVAPFGAAGAPAAAHTASAPPGDEDDGDGATRVLSEGAAPGPGSVDWTVNVTDEDQRTMNAAQIVAEYQRGVVTNDTYVWKDGMTDWLPVCDIPELKAMVSMAAPLPAAGAAAHAPAPAYAQAPVHEPATGLGGTMMMPDGPAPLAASPAASPAAARRKAPAGGVDLFGPGQQQQEVASSASSASSAASRMAGERNENSVLFSISALTAAAAAGKKGEDLLLDLAAPSPGPRNAGRADDIMNLGGGMAAPMLAPPPLLAPVVEAPPPPAPVAMAMPTSVPDAPPRKGNTGLIIGLVAGVAVLSIVGTYFAVSSGGKTTDATNAAGSTSAMASGAPQAPVSAAPVADTKPADTKPADTKPADSAVAAVDPKAVDPKGVDPKGKVPGPLPGNTGAKPADPKPGEKKPEEKKPEEKKPEEKKPDPPAGGGGKEFDRAAALASLGGAASAARGCKKDDTPTGSGKVKVTFAPSGSVTSATLESGPWAGTPAVGCIVGAFRGARVPPFDGAPVSVSKSISIN